MKHTPATPLPWQAVKNDVRGYGNPRGDVYSDDDALPRDAAYIVHAANAYPRLVAELHKAVRQFQPGSGVTESARALLAELGE